MRPNQRMIFGVGLTLQVGWALPGCGTAGNDAGTASTAGTSGASTDGDEESAGNANAGASAGAVESAGGASSGVGASMGGDGEAAGSASGGTVGTAGMCVTSMGDYKTCVLDHQNKRDAATACTPGAPDQCQDRIMNDCGCQIAVNDADSPEVACYLATLAEGSCTLCTPEPCAAPLGECEVARDRPTFCR